MATESREDWFQEALRGFLESADETALAVLPVDTASDVNLIFDVTPRGFREVVLTVVLATLRDSSYRASVDFYACHPRPLYEKGLRPVLQQFRIPCSQSGPLNIAKATKALDATWAAKRSPKAAADATLRIVTFLEEDTSHAAALANALAHHFHEQAAAVSLMQSAVSGLPSVDRLVRLSWGLIVEAPDGGNTAQRVCGSLLRQSMASSVLTVAGDSDSASTTNATSGKPGDVCVLDSEGKVQVVYEITTKGFGSQRISECTQSLRTYAEKSGDHVSNVRVLCTAEDGPPDMAEDEDIAALGLFGVMQDGGISYEFFDLSVWLAAGLINLSSEGRAAYFNHLRDYVDEPNTRVPVKQAFAKLAESE